MKFINEAVLYLLYLRNRHCFRVRPEQTLFVILNGVGGDAGARPRSVGLASAAASAKPNRYKYKPNEINSAGSRRSRA